MSLHPLIGVLAFPLLGACAILESSSGPAVVVTSTAVPLDLAVGDTARIHVTVRNNSEFAVEVLAQQCNNDFYISGSDGTAYHPAELVYCTLELKAPVNLAPGQSFEMDAFTTGRVVLQGSQDASFMLPPGTYRIRPVISVRSGDESAVVVSANPTIVTFR